MFTGRKRERKGEMRKKRVKKFFLKKHGNPPLLPFSSNFPSFPLSPTITPSFTATHGSFHIVSARQPPTLTVVLPDSLPHVVLPAAQESPLSLSQANLESPTTNHHVSFLPWKTTNHCDPPPSLHELKNEYEYFQC